MSKRLRRAMVRESSSEPDGVLAIEESWRRRESERMRVSEDRERESESFRVVGLE